METVSFCPEVSQDVVGGSETRRDLRMRREELKVTIEGVNGDIGEHFFTAKCQPSREGHEQQARKSTAR